MKNTFRYILRYSIDPAFNANERIDELVRFCQDAKIEEVMFQIMPEELSTGYPTDKELEQWLELAIRTQEALDDAGIDMSVQPWCTTYHNFRGRHLRPGQDFRRLVGENGTEHPIAVCPLSANWQEYLSRYFALFAEALQPNVIWIEDDFRLHNHDIHLTGWGGCFCEEHLKLFSKRIGQTVTREELIEKLLAKGTPHPWRDEWFNLNWETMKTPAEKIAAAVKKLSPHTRLALMTSNPDQHSIEGRKWNELADILRNEQSFIIRPHLYPYTEEAAIHNPPMVARHTIATIERPLEIHPELECGPRCGLYSKSSRFIGWQCFYSALFGSDGITINCLDLLGNGTLYFPELSQQLREQKQQLNALKAIGIDDRNSIGVNVLFHPDIARTMDGNDSATLGALINPTAIWPQTLSILGISWRMAMDIDDIPAGQPVAVGGQTLRAFSDEAISMLLSMPLLLDALSVEILLERGFGSLIGINDATWQLLDDTAYSYETVEETDASVYGIPHPRMTAQRAAGRMLEMSLGDKTETITTIRKADGKMCWPGMVTYRNEQ
ncbi:MAG: hypothetical protein ABFR33_03285, partial [Verrucomicrobiota bacterium]